jgi:hypothetical protein
VQPNVPSAPGILEEVPLGCPELCLPQEIIINNEGRSHTYEHAYAQDSRQFWVIDPSNWRLQFRDDLGKRLKGHGFGPQRADCSCLSGA